MVIMRIMDVFSPIPGMLLAIGLTTAFGRKIYILMLAIDFGRRILIFFHTKRLTL